MADRPDRQSPRRRSSDVPRLDQPQEFRRRFVPTPSFSQETFGALSEGFARWMGTAQFLFGMTVFVAIWLAWNTFADPSIQFDPRETNFTLLTLILSLQASYAAPLILLAQNRQADRDRVALEQDRARDERNLADTEFLTREVAGAANRLTRHGNSRLRPLRAAPAARRDGRTWHDLSATGPRRRRHGADRGGRTFTSGYGHFPGLGYRMAALPSDSNDGVRTGLHV